MSNDNWGSEARFGIFIVGCEVVPEAEWWAMAPPGVSVHAARVTAPAPWAQWRADRSEVDLAPDVERGAAHFASMALDAVVVAHSSSSVLGGEGWDDAVIARLKACIDGPTAVTTNGRDCVTALQALEVRRPFIVFPAWFGEKIMRASAAYLSAHGFAADYQFRHVPEQRWRSVPPEDLYSSFMHIEQRADLLLEQIVANCPADADGVLVLGTGVRCVGIIEAIEAALGRPVVTANQASLWRCLGFADVDAQISGYGRLLSLPAGQL